MTKYTLTREENGIHVLADRKGDVPAREFIFESVQGVDGLEYFVVKDNIPGTPGSTCMCNSPKNVIVARDKKAAMNAAYEHARDYVRDALHEGDSVFDRTDLG